MVRKDWHQIKAGRIGHALAAISAKEGRIGALPRASHVHPGLRCATRLAKQAGGYRFKIRTRLLRTASGRITQLHTRSRGACIDSGLTVVDSQGHGVKRRWQPSFNQDQHGYTGFMARNRFLPFAIPRVTLPACRRHELPPRALLHSGDINSSIAFPVRRGLTLPGRR